MSVDDVVPQMERGSVIPIGRFHDTLLLDLHHQRINLRSHMVSLVNPDLIKSHTHRLGLPSVLPLLKLKRVSTEIPLITSSITNTTHLCCIYKSLSLKFKYITFFNLFKALVRWFNFFSEFDFFRIFKVY